MDIKDSVAMVVDTKNSFIISNNDDLQRATEFIKDIKVRAKFVKDHYEPMIKATKDAYDRVRSERDTYLKPLEEAETDMKQIMNEYNNKILALQRAEQEAKRRAEEEQRLKLEEMQKAVVEGNAEKIQEKLEETISTYVPETTVERAQAQGMSTRMLIELEIKDISKVPATVNMMPILELSKLGRQYLIDQYKRMKSFGKEFKVEGIEFVEKVTTVIR